jgi:hypothetical protein
MEKVEEVITTKKVVHRYCDDCHAEINWSLQCSKAECQYCGKQLCEMCVAHEEETGGDFRRVYCESCSDTYRKYKPEMDAAYKSFSDIVDKMKHECKAKRQAQIMEGIQP